MLHDGAHILVQRDEISIVRPGASERSPPDPLWAKSEPGQPMYPTESAPHLVEHCETEDASSLIFSIRGSGDSDIYCIIVLYSGSARGVKTLKVCLLDPKQAPPIKPIGRRICIPLTASLQGFSNGPEGSAFLTCTLFNGQLIAQRRVLPEGEGHIMAWDCTSGTFLTSRGCIRTVKS